MEGKNINQMNKEQMKQLEKMLKERVKPADCPLLKTCEEKILEDEFKLLCKDQELQREITMVHMGGHHTWEQCGIYRKVKREKEGKIAREWK